MTEYELMQDIRKLNKTRLAYAELISAKPVNIKANRRCACCIETIPAGTRCITSSKMMDKKYDKTFRELVKNGESVGDYRFVPVRHWMHLECAAKRVEEALRLRKEKVRRDRNPYRDIEIFSDEYDKLSYEEQSEVLDIAYARGEITSFEYQEEEKALIDAMAYRDAMASEF